MKLFAYTTPTRFSYYNELTKSTFSAYGSTVVYVPDIDLPTLVGPCGIMTRASEYDMKIEDTEEVGA